MLTRADASLTGKENQSYLEKMLTFEFRKQQEYKECGGGGGGAGLGTTEGANFRLALQHL